MVECLGTWYCNPTQWAQLISRPWKSSEDVQPCHTLLAYVTKDRQGGTTFTYQINHELCGSCTQYCLASIWWGQRGITMEAFVGRPDVRRSSMGNR